MTGCKITLPEYCIYCGEQLNNYEIPDGTCSNCWGKEKYINL